MVKDISIGVLGVQGAVSEHVTSMTNALRETNNISGQVFVVNHKEELNDKIIEHGVLLHKGRL